MRKAVLVAGAAALALAAGVFVAFQASSAHASCGEITITDEAGINQPANHGCGVPAPVSPQVNNVFLCYSKYQTLPGVWPAETAADLLAEGYWYPNAVKGNVDGGPNLGPYHLVCNATGTATGMFVNENGEVVGPDIAGDNLGYYPAVS